MKLSILAFLYCGEFEKKTESIAAGESLSSGHFSFY